MLLVAVALRVWALDRVPPGLHFDEAVYGLMARDIQAGARPVFFSAYTGREPLYMYLMAAVFARLGSTVWALRLTSAMIGAVTVAAVYVLARALFGRRVALASAVLLATNYWHLTVSRNGYPNVLIPPLAALSAYFLWRAWRAPGRALLAWVAAGALSGLVLYTYLAARFWPVFLGMLLAYALLVARGRVKRHALGMAACILAAGLVFLPLGVHFVRHPADFTERADQVLAWKQLSGSALLTTIADNAWQTARGTVGRGDPRWHYNLPGRAMLQPWVGVFFLAGLAVALRHWRDPRHGLLLLWLVVMALPGILTLEMQPAGQRVFGSLPALVILAGLGLVRVVELAAGAARRRGGRVAVPSAAVAAAVVLVAMLDGVVTADDYFRDWARSPTVAMTFHADYAAMAALASGDVAACRTVVILSEHYKHPTVAFLEPSLVDGAVWADGSLAVPVPQRPGECPGADDRPIVYYRLTASLADDAPASDWLAARATSARSWTVASETAGAEGPVSLDVVRYEVPSDRSEPDGPAVSLGGEVSAWPAALPVAASRNRSAIVPVEWRVDRSPDGGRGFSLRLVDESGVTWSQVDAAGYLAEQWRAGDRVTQWFALPIEATMPPGDYQADLVLLDETGKALPVDGGAHAATVATVRVSPEGRQRADRSAVPQGSVGDLALVEAMPPQASVPGGWLDIAPLWARWGPDPPSLLTVELVSDDGNTRRLGELPPSADSYPPALWRDRELARARHRLRVPADLAAGDYAILARAPMGGVEIGSLSVSSPDRVFEAPPMDHPVGAIFGGARLLGYDLRPEALSPGQAVDLRLYWRADAGPLADGKVFVHAYARGDRLVAQHDGVPVGGTRPLPGWLPGEVVIDEHRIELPAELPPGGSVEVAVGLYDPVTGARWPARDAQGAPVSGDALTLTTLALR